VTSVEQEETQLQEEVRKADSRVTLQHRSTFTQLRKEDKTTVNMTVGFDGKITVISGTLEQLLNFMADETWQGIEGCIYSDSI
jgi:hypothetical protein